MMKKFSQPSRAASQPEEPPIVCSGSAASEESSAYWVAVKERLVRLPR